MGKADGSIVDGPKALLQQIPSVDRLLRGAQAQALIARHGNTLVASQARELLQALRQQVLDAREGAAPDAADWSEEALAHQLQARCAARLAPRMKPVLNLSGTVIHTNLGRSVLPQAAIRHIVAMMAGPNNLEYDVQAGARGDRDSIVEGLICEITGAQAATVVNNNAAAVLLAIAALARGREVIVSRGELVEIGGAFRMPDVMASAGARMVEVGTTNRTHLHDYERAIGPDTALLMKVHTSNYAVQGFTSAVSEAELAPLARARGVALATDLGSGSLVDMTRLGLPAEPTPQQMLAAGCGVVTFSGDKLLGGPQAGLIVGERELVGRIRKFPMKRALRLSKLPLAALEATLMLYLQPEILTRELPTLRLLTRPLAQIDDAVDAVLPALAAAVQPRFAASRVDLSSQIGSGSLPVERLPSRGIALVPAQTQKKGTGTALDALAAAMRALPLPVIGRISEDRFILDCRCLEEPAQLLGQLPRLKELLA